MPCIVSLSLPLNPVPLSDVETPYDVKPAQNEQTPLQRLSCERPPRHLRLDVVLVAEGVMVAGGCDRFLGVPLTMTVASPVASD